MKELDKRFINYLSPRLPRFHWERENVANFRCPLCGDSQRSLTKARGYFYLDTKLDEFRFKCHNCGECDGWTLKNWLGKFDSSLAEEYNMEKFKEVGSGRERLTPLRKSERVLNQSARIVQREAVRKTELIGNMVMISQLPSDHYARRYVEGRRIPSKFMDLLYFTKNYKQDIKGFETDLELWNKQPEDERLVIPFWTQDGRLKAVQGRAFDSSALRYITTKPNTDDTKIYGEDRLIRGKTTLVVEGPIDSMFLPNCLATADANLLNAKGDIYIPDNQYRNTAVCGIIDKIIKAGVKVVLFPPSVPWKDINDMISPDKGNMSQNVLFQLIGSNVYHGMAAELRFADLRKA